MQPRGSSVGGELELAFGASALLLPAFHGRARGAGTQSHPVAAVRRAAIVAALAWLPLALACGAEGSLAGGPGSFLRDVGIHARLLVALPLLVFAEQPVGRRLRLALRYLDDAGLIDPSAIADVQRAVERVRSARASWITSVALVALVAVASVPLATMAPPAPTWAHPLATADSAGPLSVAGWIDLAWGSALYRLVAVRWILELGLWFTLLARLARLPLRTNALHHDRMGGLGPVADAHDAFAWVVLAASAAIAGRLVSHVALTGDDAFAHWEAVSAFCVLAPLPLLAPMMVFLPALERDRRRALEALGAAVAQETRRFRQEYLAAPGDRPLANAAADVMVLADLTPTFERVHAAFAIPFRRANYLWLVAAAAVPMLGFFLHSVPLADLIRELQWLMGS